MKIVPLFSSSSLLNNNKPKASSKPKEDKSKPAPKQKRKAKDGGKKPTKKTKGKATEPVVPEEPAKKVGRPSNQELAEREDKKRKEAEALRQSLADRQKDLVQTVHTGSKIMKTAVVVDAEQAAESLESFNKELSEQPTGSKRKTSEEILKELMQDPNWVPPYPVFTTGQRVSTKTSSGLEYKGYIDHDPIISELVRVAWDDGSVQYAAKGNLVVIQKKVVKSLFKQRSKKQSKKEKETTT
jgi:hypothetical protein